jgi:hypothetical protein
MNPDKLAFIVVNVVGGTAVLASYALWLQTPTNNASILWGSIEGAGRTLYGVSMLAAAAGYFAFAGHLLASDVESVPWSLFIALFALILFPSALWMPLSFEYVRAPSPALWWAVRITLAVVGLASLGLIFALARHVPGGAVHGLAVAGAVAFTFQTLVLDAIVWPLYFSR